MTTIEELEKADPSVLLSANQQADSYYKGTDAIWNFANTNIRPILAGQLNLNRKEGAIVGTYYRMLGWLHSLIRLNDPRDFQGIASAARALFELLLDIKILADDTSGDALNKFHVFREIAAFQAAENIVSFCNKHPNTTIVSFRHRGFVNDQGRRWRIEQNRAGFWGVDKNRHPIRPKHWTGKNVHDRARDIDIKYQEWYVESYYFLSFYVHSGSEGIWELDKDAVEIVVAISHDIAQKCFIEATKIVSRAMKIDRDRCKTLFRRLKMAIPFSIR